MILNVKFYAVCREIAGTESTQIEFNKTPTRGDFWEKIHEMYPEMNRISSNVALALNNKYISGNDAFQDGDKISLIPPVSGG